MIPIYPQSHRWSVLYNVIYCLFSSRAITSTSSSSYLIWKLRYTFLTLPIYVKRALPMKRWSHRSYDQFLHAVCTKNFIFLIIMHSLRTLWFRGTILIRWKALGSIQLLCSHLGGKGGSIKMWTYANRGEELLSQCKRSHLIFSISYLVHELFTTMTRFFVSFIKMSCSVCSGFLWLSWIVEFPLKRELLSRE